MNKTRIGFVGTGLMGQCAHLWNYIAIEECEVVALAELRPELARRPASVGQTMRLKTWSLCEII
jgi:predicted dehydrogenase